MITLWTSPPDALSLIPIQQWHQWESWQQAPPCGGVYTCGQVIVTQVFVTTHHSVRQITTFSRTATLGVLAKEILCHLCLKHRYGTSHNKHEYNNAFYTHSHAMEWNNYLEIRCANYSVLGMQPLSVDMVNFMCAMCCGFVKKRKDSLIFVLLNSWLV